jgi:hypothetical protein
MAYKPSRRDYNKINNHTKTTECYIGITKEEVEKGGNCIRVSAIGSVSLLHKIFYVGGDVLPDTLEWYGHIYHLVNLSFVETSSRQKMDLAFYRVEYHNVVDAIGYMIALTKEKRRQNEMENIS